MSEQPPTNSTILNEREREIVTTRLMHAPRDLVFAAWTQPEHLAQWWGPIGFTNTFQEFDLRPGGTWQFIMHGPTGVDFPNKSVFVEIVAPERIVFDHASGPKFRVIATFEEQAENTLLTFRMCFATAAELDKVKSFAVEGNKENVDKLEAYLQTMSGNQLQ